MPDADQGAAFLNQGISQGLDQWEKTYQNGKIADSVVKTNPELLDALGMSQEQFGSQSATDKMSAITGLFQAQGAQQHAQMVQAQLADFASQAQERQGVANWRNAQSQRQTAQDAEDATTGAFLKNYYNAPAQPAASAPMAFSGAGGDPTAAMMASGADPAIAAGAGTQVQDPNYRIASALAMTPGVGGKSFLNAYRTLAQYGGLDGNDNSPAFTSDPSGNTIAYNRKSGAFQFSPGVTSLTDPTTGEVVPGGYVTRNGVRFQPPTKAPDQSIIDSREQSALSSWHKRLDPVQTQLEFAQSKASDPAAAPADRDKYTKLLPALAKQRDQILSERPGVNAPTTPAEANAAPAIAAPKSQADFAALPSGSKFVNPADGRILTKK